MSVARPKIRSPHTDQVQGRQIDECPAECIRAYAEVNPEPRQTNLFPDLFLDAGPEPSMLVNSDAIGRKCRYCQNETFITTPPKPPHSMGIECIACGRHNGWLPHDVADALLRGGLQ